MSNDDEPDAPDPAVKRRQQAQGAAGDLARMGIDPRSLGLGAPNTPPSPPKPPQPDQGADVVQLRPQHGASPLEDSTKLPQSRPHERPVAPYQGSTAPPVPPDARAPQGPPAASPPGAPLPPLPDTNVVAPPATAPPPVMREAPRMLKRVAAGVVTPDAAVAIQGERALIDAVRSRQSNRRVVAVISGKGGVGCTTVAVALGTVLVAMRDDRTVLVDVQQGTASLGELLRVAQPRSVASLLAENEAVDPPLAATGLAVIDGAGWDQGLKRGDVSGALERLGNEHSFNLLDVGNDAGEGGHTALARADQVVIVTGPGRLGAAAMQTAYDRVRLVNPAAAGGVITVVVCPHEDAFREARRDLRPSPRLMLVPPEPALAVGRPFEPAVVSSVTREAMLHLAAQVASGTRAHG